MPLQDVSEVGAMKLSINVGMIPKNLDVVSRLRSKISN